MHATQHNTSVLHTDLTRGRLYTIVFDCMLSHVNCAISLSLSCSVELVCASLTRGREAREERSRRRRRTAARAHLEAAAVHDLERLALARVLRAAAQRNTTTKHPRVARRRGVSCGPRGHSAGSPPSHRQNDLSRRQREAHAARGARRRPRPNPHPHIRARERLPRRPRRRRSPRTHLEHGVGDARVPCVYRYGGAPGVDEGTAAACARGSIDARSARALGVCGR